MDSIIVQGGMGLQVKVKIQGSKNAALPILAACLLTKEQVVLENCPKISDVFGMLHILESLGCRVTWEKDALCVKAENVDSWAVPKAMARSMRSSIFLLGALLGRNKKAKLDFPGGCVIGKRPIDLHLKGLIQMGVSFEQGDDTVEAQAPEGLHGAEIQLGIPSVGATENLIMAGVRAKGTTRILGAAREPEVQALCGFLSSCGAVIKGIGEPVITIEGGHDLKGVTYQIPADRIVAGTYLFSGFATGGEIFLEDAPLEHMAACMEIAESMGAVLTGTEEGLYVQYPQRAGCLPYVKTEVYPGFPTDLQSALLAVRCTGLGETVMQETIFEDRFRVMEELNAMGARVIPVDQNSVRIIGVDSLHGANIHAYELRGGAALVIAALGARGTTVIRGRHFIERGYESIGRDFRELGARIVSD